MSTRLLTKFRPFTWPLENICQRCLQASYSGQARFPVLKLDDLDPNVSSANKDSFLKYEEVYKSALAIAHAGGGAKAIERHKQRNKMLVEERVKSLLDEETPFLELSPLAGFMMEYGTVPRAGSLNGL